MNKLQTFSGANISLKNHVFKQFSLNEQNRDASRRFKNNLEFKEGPGVSRDPEQNIRAEVMALGC